jgi:hypothetical protein
LLLFLCLFLVIGGNQAIREIEHEGVALQLCSRCQETVERARRIYTSVLVQKLPRPSERVNRVILYMESYPDKVAVIKAGLDALIFFSRNGPQEL